jgi:hypothetical protein
VSNTYTIKALRAVSITAAQKALHPDRVMTLHGIFFDSAGNRQSRKSEIITTEDVTSSDFAFDPVAGVLTLPGGTRGRPVMAALSATDALALVKATRDALALDALQETAQIELAAEKAAEAVTAPSTPAAEAPAKKK